MIVLTATATSVWGPLSYLAVPGSLALAYLYWQLSHHIGGTVIKILAGAWLTMAVTVLGQQLGVAGSAIGVVVSAAAIAFGYLAISLQRAIHPFAVWLAALVGLMLPILAITAATLYTFAAPTVGGVAEASGTGVAVAITGLIGAQGLCGALAAFGTNETF